MEIKKYARVNLENYSKLFLQLGLALALFVIYLAINIKSFDKHISTLNGSFNQDEVIEEVPITKRVEHIKPPPPPPPAPEIITVVKNNVKVDEDILASTESGEDVAIKPVAISDIKVVDEDEDVKQDIPFAFIEDAPVFPGCKGSKAAKKKCFSEKMTAHIKKNFNSDIAQELGLAPGIKKIFIQFTINKTGNITNIKIRAPHKSLEKEALRVMKLLPKMTPGMQRDKPVNVRYVQPIIFKVID